MPPLPIVKSRQVAAALRRAGFARIAAKGSHDKYRHPDGRIAIVVDYGSRDYPAGTLRETVKQAGLTVAEFRALLRA